MNRYLYSHETPVKRRMNHGGWHETCPPASASSVFRYADVMIFSESLAIYMMTVTAAVYDNYTAKVDYAFDQNMSLYSRLPFSNGYRHPSR